MRPAQEYIPAAPFVEWLAVELRRLRAMESLRLDERYQKRVPSNTVLARRLGMSVKALYRYSRSINDANEHVDVFERNRVEDALDRADRRLFAQLYPEVAVRSDVELEPDIFCESCRETVTPIDGCCPWCTPEPGHPQCCPGCGGWKATGAVTCAPCFRRSQQAMKQVAA